MSSSNIDIKVYAKKCYYKVYYDEGEFTNDFKKFAYIKKLLSKSIKGGTENTERLILNHLITVYNVFGSDGAFNILVDRLDEYHQKMLKPFLFHLNYIKEGQMLDIEMDQNVVESLRNVK